MSKNIYKVLSLFSGIGGLCHQGIKMAELSHKFKVTQFVENSEYAQSQLRLIQPDTPIHSDINNYHPRNREIMVVCGGFPCAGTSNAGKRQGLDDPRSGLWQQMFRIIRECQANNHPDPFVLIENPTGLLNRGFAQIIDQLDEIRFVGEWLSVSAQELGLPHRRKRLFIIAYSARLQHHKIPLLWTGEARRDIEEIRISQKQRSYQSGICEVDDGLPIGVNKRIPGNFDARRALGLSCSPRQSAVAWKRLDYLTSLLA